MEKSFLLHILYYSYNYTILIFRIFLNFDSFLLTIPFFLSLKKRRRKGFSVVSSRVNVLRGNEKRGIEGGRGERKREQQLLKAEAREREREDSKLALIGEWLAILHRRGWRSTVGRVDFFFFIALWGLSCREQGNRFGSSSPGDTLASS